MVQGPVPVTLAGPVTPLQEDEPKVVFVPATGAVQPAGTRTVTSEELLKSFAVLLVKVNVNERPDWPAVTVVGDTVIVPSPLLVLEAADATPASMRRAPNAPSTNAGKSITRKRLIVTYPSSSNSRLRHYRIELRCGGSRIDCAEPDRPREDGCRPYRYGG